MGPNRHLWLVAALCGLMGLSLTACGGDSQGTDTPRAALGESCQDASGCQSGLLCIAGTCRDPNESPDMSQDQGVEPDDMATEDSGGEPDADTPEDMGADTGAPDTGTPDTGTPDTGTPDMNPVDMGEEEDLPAPERPEVLTGGVSIFEARIKANNLITIRRGNAGAAFVEPSADPAPIETFGDCQLLPFDPDESNEQRGYDAGIISVTAGARQVVLTPEREGDSYLYASSLGEDNEDVYGNNQTIMINGGGGAHVGPFVGALTSPQEHSVSAPAADSTIGDGPLDIAWGPAQSEGEIAITISPMNQSFQPVAGVSLNCLTTDTGSFTVPAEAMARIDADRLALVVIKVFNQEVQVGDDTLFLNLTSASGNVIKR